MQKTIITIQHTQSEHHTNGMIGAWGDWNLTELGRRHATDIGNGLVKEIKPEEYVMYTSDLKRAYQTAENVAGVLHMSPIIDERLREVNAGEGNGKPVKWYRENEAPRSGGYDPDYKPFPDAESDRDLWNRLYPLYQEIISSEQEKIILVSHGTSLSFLQSMLWGDCFEDIRRRRYNGSGGSVSKFVIQESGKVIIEYLNRRF